VQIIS